MNSHGNDHPILQDLLNTRKNLLESLTHSSLTHDTDVNALIATAQKDSLPSLFISMITNLTKAKNEAKIVAGTLSSASTAYDVVKKSLEDNEAISEYKKKFSDTTNQMRLLDKNFGPLTTSTQAMKYGDVTTKYDESKTKSITPLKTLNPSDLVRNFHENEVKLQEYLSKVIQAPLKDAASFLTEFKAMKTEAKRVLTVWKAFPVLVQTHYLKAQRDCIKVVIEEQQAEINRIKSDTKEMIPLYEELKNINPEGQALANQAMSLINKVANSVSNPQKSESKEATEASSSVASQGMYKYRNPTDYQDSSTVKAGATPSPFG